MDMKEFRASLEAMLVRDQKWLEKIEPILQKASRQDPANRKILGPLRELKRTLLSHIKTYEKMLAKLSKQGHGS